MGIFLLDGLKYHYDCDQLSGTRFDDGPNELDVGVIGGVSSVAGILVRAVNTTGNPLNILEAAHDDLFRVGDNDFTLTFWNLIATGKEFDNHELISHFDNDGVNERGYLARYTTVGDKYTWHCSADGISGTTLTFGSTLTKDVWNFIVCKHNASANEISLEINRSGLVSTAHTGGIFNNTSPFNIGAAYLSTGLAAGSTPIDEVAAWDRLLNSDELDALYGSGTPPGFDSYVSEPDIDRSRSSGRETIVIIELEQDQCRLLYGESPCTAALGTTGTRKCYNTRSTCQDRENYDSKPLVSDSEAEPQNISSAGAVEASFDVSTEDVTPQDLKFKRDGTKLYMLGGTSDKVHQYPLTTAWDISTAGAVEEEFSVAGEDTFPAGIFFKSDGTKLYYVGRISDKVHQYPLSTAWDISTTGLVEEEFSVAGEDTSPTGVFFKTDGTKLYMIGTVSNKVHQYPLSTAWDISTAGAVEESFDVSGEQLDPQGISFTSQGAKLYVIGEGAVPNFVRKVHQYALATPWDLSTAGAVEASFDVSSEDLAPRGVTFKTDGTKLYIVGTTSQEVHQYPIVGAVAGIARDATGTQEVSTVGAVEESFSVSGEDTNPQGLFFKSDGTKLYIIGTTSQEVHQYPLSTAWDIGSAGAVEESFDVSGEETNPRDFFLKSDGTKLYVVGTTSDEVHQYPLTSAWDISTVGAVEESFDVSTEEALPAGIFFKSDGTKLYIVGVDSDEVQQYPLSTAWDIGSAGAVEETFSVTDDAAQVGLFFRSDGRKMYIVGEIADIISQYPLSTAWDISTAGAVESTRDVTTEDGGPNGVFFKPDGRKMYMIGNGSDSVHQYPVPFIEGEIQGAVHVRSDPTGFGQALSFDGVDDSVEILDVLDAYGFAAAAPFTIEFLLNPSSIPNSFARLFDKEFEIIASPGAQGWRILLRRSGTSLIFERLLDGAADSAVAVVSLLEPRFWSAVYDGTDLILYEEGLERARSTSSKLLIDNGEPLTIGNTFVGETAEPYHGLLDEVRIWSVARTEAEIRERMVLPLSGLEAGLSSYFPLDDAPPGVATRTLRFTKPQTSAPRDLYLLPLLVDVDTAPTRINPGGGSRDRGVLGDRASVDIGFKDAPGSGRVVDKYRTERISGTAQTDEGGYEPLERGSFWAKWRARNLFFQNRRVRILEGYIGEKLRDMQSREYFIDQLRGPDGDGRTVIRAKDVLKLADDERAQAPQATPGELNAALTDSETTSFQATGALIADYPDEPGLVRIGSEVIEYQTRTQATANDVQFNTLTRGTRGSAAAAHDLEDRVQRCLEFVSVLPWKLAEDLLVNFGNVPQEFIPIADWDAEGATWLTQFTLSAVITEPTSVTTLLSEITQQAQFFIWWDEYTQMILLKVLRPPTEDPVAINDVSHLIERASVIKEHPNQRLSQVWVFFIQKDPTKRLDDESNFARVRIRADLEAEGAAQYGESRISKIFSRWLETEGQVSQVTKRTLDRYRDNPRTLEVRVDAKDRAALRVGEVADIMMRTILDDRGLEVSTLWQVISAREDPPGEAVALELLSFDFTGRFAFYMETAAPIFANATDEEKKSGAWYAGDDGKFSDGTDGYQYQ